MNTKKLEIFFMLIVVLFSSVLALNYYRSHNFENNPLSKQYKEKIEQSQNRVLQNMKNNFGFSIKFPIIITSKIPGKLYGLTTLKNGKITIFLNKKVMRESMDYITNDVIPHEYAHALLFYLHKNTNENGGHSELWRETCLKLGGTDCRRYVNQDEVIIAKMPFRDIVEKIEKMK